MKRYRVVRTPGNRYRIHVWRLWWPFWVHHWDKPGLKTSYLELEDAMKAIDILRNYVAYEEDESFIQ